MTSPAIAHKIQKDAPDFYTAKISFYNSNKKELKLVSHGVNHDCFDYISHEGLRGLIPLNSIVEIEFDSNFSKLKELEVKAKNESKRD